MDVNDATIRYDLLKKTGEWWVNPCWEEESYIKGLGIPLEEINNAINCLSKIFTAEWFLSHNLDNDYHPFIFNLISMGMIPLVPLVKLGTELNLVHSKNHLLGDLKKRLRDNIHFDGARFEIEIIAFFIRQGFSVSRDTKKSKNSKNFDFKVSSGKHTINFELKSLKKSKISKERDSFFIQLIVSIIQITQCPINFEFLPSFHEFSQTKDGHDYIIKNLDSIIQTTTESIITAEKNKQWGTHIIPDLGQFEIYENKGSNSGSIGGLQQFSKSEFKRILSNAINDANLQLVPPGILMIKTDYPIDKNTNEYINNFFNENGEDYKNISTVITIFSTLIHGNVSKIENQIFFIENPFAEDVRNSKIFESLNKLDNVS